MSHTSTFTMPQHFSRTDVETRQRRDQFSIQRLEQLLQHCPSQEIMEERMVHYEVTWVQAGTGCIGIDSTQHTIAANTLYCAVPGQVRRLLLNEGTRGYRLLFSRDFLFLSTPGAGPVSRLDSYGSENCIPVLETDEEMREEMQGLLHNMEKELRNFYLLRSEVLSGLLNLFVIYLSRKMDNGSGEHPDSKDADLVRKFRLLLKENFTTKKQVADYASELFVTPNYLNRKVKKITGFTASYLIQQQIILEAKRQAIHSNISMKEIAYFLGFEDLAHFSKFFKNNSGMNFSNFKKGLSLSI